MSGCPARRHVGAALVCALLLAPTALAVPSHALGLEGDAGVREASFGESVPYVETVGSLASLDASDLVGGTGTEGEGAGGGGIDGLETVGTATQSVSTLAELKAALDDRNVAEIVLTDDIQSVRDVLTCERTLTLQLNNHILSFDDAGSLTVSSGDVCVRNGSVFSWSKRDDGQPLKVTGTARVTLAGNLMVHAYYVGCVGVSGTGRLTVEDADLTGGSERHAVIDARDQARVEVAWLELSPRDGATCIGVRDGAVANVRGAKVFSDAEPAGVAAYVPYGYRLNRSSVAGIYYVQGDLAGPLASVSVSPSSYSYDGTRHEPSVTVTFDGVDVTDDCTVSYENNREVGTAKVTVKPMWSSDALCGSATATFTITGEDATKDPSSGTSGGDDGSSGSGSSSGESSGAGTSGAVTSAGETTGTRRVQASTLAALKAALADRTVAEIVLTDDIQSVRDVLTCNRSLTLNLNSHILSFDDAGSLTVRAGDVCVRNGSVFSWTKRDDGQSLKVAGGTLTLAGGLMVHAYYVGCVGVSGTGRLIVEDADLTGGSERHAVIDARDQARVEAIWLELSPRDGATCIRCQGNAKATVKGAQVFSDAEPAGIKAYIPSGYRLNKSSVANLYFVQGDLGGTLASVSVNPSSYCYDGTRHEPTVRVTFDGVDVTDDCTVSYENNREVGTAKVTVKPKSSSDALCGSATATFTMTGASESEGKKSLGGATVRLSPDSFTYDGSAKEPILWVTVGGSYVPDREYSVSYSNNRDAGTATVTISANSSGNYTGSVSRSFTINRKEVTVYADSHMKAAGKPDPTLTATVIGTVGSDQVSYTVSRQQGETAGSYTITPSGSSEQGNYRVTYKTGTLTIYGTAESSVPTPTTTPQTPQDTRATSIATPNTAGTGSVAGTPTPIAATGSAAVQQVAPVQAVRSQATPMTADASPFWSLPLIAGSALALIGGARRRRR